MVYTDGMIVKGKIKIFSRSMSDAIRDLRKERGWTQKRLADELGKTVMTVTRWEMGVRTPPPDTLLRLANLALSPELRIFLGTPPLEDEAHPRGAMLQPSMKEGLERELTEALRSILNNAPEEIVEKVADDLIRFARIYGARRKTREKEDPKK